MRRRQFLGATAGMTGAFAGCVVGWQGDSSSDTGDTPSTTETVAGVELPVPRGEIDVPLPPDHIPAITEPTFADDWSDLDPDGIDDPTLPEETAVIGIERDGEARAYPLRILDWHEIVNDDFAGPIAVTYCVLCGSTVVVERRVEGVPTVFGVSGQLWRDDLVMYDRATESLWSQILRTAIRGPRTGDRLERVESTLSSWGEWQHRHPGTDVLLPPPHSNTVRGPDQTFPYFRSKYNYEDQTQLIGIDDEEGDLRDRTLVLGVATEEKTRAYPFPIVREADVINDTVGSLPVVVSIAPDDSLVAYDRRVGGRPRTFEPAGERYFAAAGTRFERTTGDAVDGPFSGVRLERANGNPPMFWRGWSNFNPETTVYGRDG